MQSVGGCAGPLIILSWLPMYLATQFGLDAGTSAALSIAPWAVNIACTNLGGYLGDKVGAFSSRVSIRSVLNSESVLSCRSLPAASHIW